MIRYCAICGRRPATERTDWDDRMVDCCADCLAPVEIPETDADPYETARNDPWRFIGQPEVFGGNSAMGDGARTVAILTIVEQWPGVTVKDFAREMGIEDGDGYDVETHRAYRRACMALSRLARLGRVRREGKAGQYRHFPVSSKKEAA